MRNRAAKTRDEGAAQAPRVPSLALRAVFLAGYSMKRTAKLFGLPFDVVEKRLRKALFR